MAMLTEPTPILQFGTSRFLLAHVDLFISEAIEAGPAIGRVTIVQTTDSAESAGRVAALQTGEPYPVRIRGIVDGETIDELRHGRAVAGAYSAARDWGALRKAAIAAEVIISNTGERGYELDPQDNASTIADRSRPPKSYPAKLAALMLERWERRPEAPLSVFPCELIQRNGDRLRDIIRSLALDWEFPDAFLDWFDSHGHFGNSLVDRIVSEAIQPIGAVAEPYALWAIERQPGLVIPCSHPCIVVTDDLDQYESLKLHILNLGHTWLADQWLRNGRPKGEIVREIMADAAVRDELEAVWRDEVVPVFAARGLGDKATAYVDAVRDRFLNPFLAHKLSDIAGNHEEKKRRRLLPIVESGIKIGLTQKRLRAVLGE